MKLYLLIIALFVILNSISKVSSYSAKRFRTRKSMKQRHFSKYKPNFPKYKPNVPKCCRDFTQFTSLTDSSTLSQFMRDKIRQFQINFLAPDMSDPIQLNPEIGMCGTPHHNESTNQVCVKLCCGCCSELSVSASLLNFEPGHLLTGASKSVTKSNTELYLCCSNDESTNQSCQVRSSRYGILRSFEQLLTESRVITEFAYPNVDESTDTPTADSDWLVVSSGATVNALDGNDRVEGCGDFDGGPGDDFLEGCGSGGSTFNGNSGSDILLVSPYGPNTLDGGSENDLLMAEFKTMFQGGEGCDWLVSGSDYSTIRVFGGPCMPDGGNVFVADGLDADISFQNSDFDSCPRNIAINGVVDFDGVWVSNSTPGFPKGGRRWTLEDEFQIVKGGLPVRVSCSQKKCAKN
eukprot:456180_1